MQSQQNGRSYWDRWLVRAALAIALGTVLLAITSITQAATEKYRLVWRDDPATTMTIGWNQLSGTDYQVCYGTSEAALDTCQAPDREIEYREMNNKFVRLTGLAPDTAYYFQVQDSEGASATMWFKTAPASPSDFTFIAGGDSRTNEQPRRWGQVLVGKIRPLFIVQTGDFLDDGTAAEWDQWLDEWQLTQSDDGRMYPIIPVHGNHENADREMVHNIFDTPKAASGEPDAYFGLSVAGNMIRLYTLNSELEPGVGYGEFSGQDATKWNEQAAWLEQDLQTQAADHTWNIVTYHRPMRPHTSGKTEGLGRIAAWADPMYEHGVDLAIECDTHMSKHTFPVKPSHTLTGNGDNVTGAENVGVGSFQSFTRDENGIVFTGEGSWGAPTRPDNDYKPWTIDSDSFWQFRLVHASPDTLKIHTVRFGNKEDLDAGIEYNLDDVTALTQAEQDADPFAIPAGLDLWNPLSGEVLTLPFAGTDTGTNNLDLIEAGSNWRYLDDGSDQGTDWRATDFDDSGWKQGQAELGYGDGDETTPIGYGGDDAIKHLTYYFRQKFTLNNPEDILRLNLWLKQDDGAIVYLNGTEILRQNMPDGPVAFDTSASGSPADESSFVQIPVRPEQVAAGENTVAVEVHQRSADSSDVSFDMNLTAVMAGTGGTAPAAPSDFAGEASSTEEIVLSWTDNADNEVHYELQQQDSEESWRIVDNRLDPDTIEYTAQGLDSATDYTYRVRAVNAYGLSDYSDPVTVTTQDEGRPVLLKENFSEGDLGAMEAVSYTSNNDWKHDVRDGLDAAYMNGYGADEASNDWLLTPALNLPAYDDPTLTFDSYVKYDGGTLEVLVSTDYAGDGDPAAASWTPLDAVPHTKNEDGTYTQDEAWTDSGAVALADFGGQTAYVAFHYVSTGTGGGDGPAWYITNVKVTGDRSKLVDSDFNDNSLNGWHPVSVASNANWTPSTDTANEEMAAYINGYGADTASDDWLISPALDFDRFGSPQLKFDQWTKYGGGELYVKISTDYDGSGDPYGFNWNTLDAVKHTKDANGDWQPFDTWIRDTEVDLTPFTDGDAYLAFHYISTGTGAGDGPKWAIDNVEITGKDRAQAIQTEDFQAGTIADTSWEQQDVASDAGWETRTEAEGVPAAYMNGFGADVASEDWLISPAIDLGEAQAAFATFQTYVKYGGGDLQLFAATNYTGDPTAASWQELSFNRPEDDSQVWTPSGEVSLNDYLGETSVHLGFKYTSTGTGPGDGAAWYVADIETHQLTEAQALPLSGSFSASHTQVRTEIDTISFEANALNGAGAPYSYAWDFGDGSTATGKTVEHTYLTAGTYTVTVTITDAMNNQVAVTKDDLVEAAQVTRTDVPAKTGDVRVASFNTSLFRDSATGLIEDLATGDDLQAQRIAETLQRVRPGVVILNEFDWHKNQPDAAVEAFLTHYLSVSQNGAAPIDYPYVYRAPVNTGMDPMDAPNASADAVYDFDNDGEATGVGNDAMGFGMFHGQYGMVLLSQYPILEDQVRTFQTFLWKDMAEPMLPSDPADGSSWYSEAELAIFRLSSKSHWDVPVEIDGKAVHILASHPTPPVFDGEEDRNGTRNHDEIRFWADHIDPANSDYIYDDAGDTGGLAADTPFVIVGDLNASAVEGDGTDNPMALLLDNPLVQGDFKPTSEGGLENAPNHEHAASHTASWQLRADYVLPSATGLDIEQGEVFWPTSSHVWRYLMEASDHRLVWVDLTVTTGDTDGTPDGGSDHDVGNDGDDSGSDGEGGTGDDTAGNGSDGQASSDDDDNGGSGASGPILLLLALFGIALRYRRANA